METLCWFCEKAAGGCSWSRKFKPVDGWDAKKTEIMSWFGGTQESYLVFSCPQFELTPSCREEYEEREKKLTELKRKHVDERRGRRKVLQRSER